MWMKINDAATVMPLSLIESLPSMTTSVCVGTVVAVVLSFSGSNMLRAKGVERKVLQSAKELRCEFSAYAKGLWTNGEAVAQVQPRVFSVRFSEIDTQDGTA